jgi:hypothetical protein
MLPRHLEAGALASPGIAQKVERSIRQNKTFAVRAKCVATTYLLPRSHRRGFVTDTTSSDPIDAVAADRGRPITAEAPAAVAAPALVVPRVFEPGFCRQLIEYYNARGGHESGFMRDLNGKTVEIVDYNHKRRRDEEIVDQTLRRECMIRIHDRLVPEIRKAYQFEATRIERYVVACYEAETGGHFRTHRDNTTLGTAHRRFAVSLHLNPDEYDGGRLRFPEFGQQLYTAPIGAVVFSCSLLHEATPVTRGPTLIDLSESRRPGDPRKMFPDRRGRCAAAVHWPERSFIRTEQLAVREGRFPAVAACEALLPVSSSMRPRQVARIGHIVIGHD